MLSTNKPLMKQRFASMLTDKVGMFYKAAYDAYMASMDDQDVVKTNDQDLITSVGKAGYEMQKLKKEKADAFASSFVESLKNSGFDDLLTNEIDKHVKSLSLMITMQPQGLATLISPAGPCTGTMIISDATATIKVL